MAKRPRNRVQPSTFKPLNLQPATCNLQPLTFNLGQKATQSRSI
ncbi:MULTISPECIES: hypothetical protein [unclassified Moorena]|nr:MULTISPECIES: hypothetical protein [unclassified Moorena]